MKEISKLLEELFNCEDVESIQFDDSEICANNRIVASVIKEKVENYIKRCDDFLIESSSDFPNSLFSHNVGFSTWFFKTSSQRLI